MLERDNRGIGVDDPIGARAVGSKRIYKINITGATDVTAISLGRRRSSIRRRRRHEESGVHRHLRQHAAARWQAG